MKRYTFVDYATQGYLALVGLLVLLCHNGTVPRWGWLALAHLLAIGLVHALIRAHARWPENRVLDFLRHFYPVLFYTAFYRETGVLNHLFTSGYLDPQVIRVEQFIFGGQPSVGFMERFPSRWLAELLYFSYFSYYLMIGGVGLALLIRDRRQFAHFVSTISVVFYLCYLIYIFTPVMGPRAFFREIGGYLLPDDLQALAASPSFPESVQQAVFFQIMKFIYHHFEAPGAAFPSSHVTVALCTVYFSFRYLRPVRWVHLVLAVLLCVSTVYGRYHYVVDVAAGMLAASVMGPLANWLFWRYGPNPTPASSPPAGVPAAAQTDRS